MFLEMETLGLKRCACADCRGPTHKKVAPGARILWPEGTELQPVGAHFLCRVYASRPMSSHRSVLRAADANPSSRGFGAKTFSDGAVAPNGKFVPANSPRLNGRR